MIDITLDHVWGFVWAVQRARLSHSSKSNSEMNRLEVLDREDLYLVEGLITAGPSHSKFRRCIVVWITIRAPRYWWAQLDTYKVGTTALSESTMHTILKHWLTVDDFSGHIPIRQIEFLNNLIEVDALDSVKSNLPEGFLQTRGICLNYQVLRTMYHQRRYHRLQEWQIFCDWMRELPYSWMITAGEK